MSKFFKVSWLLLPLFFTLPSYSQKKVAQSFAKSIEFKVTKWTLDNGLTVLVHEDHSVPIYSFNQWFRVGSRNEKPGRTGLAHFFEHLMFKGTDTISGSEFERLIKSNGGSNNAFTSKDYTGYYENMPTGTLEVILKIEADRMRNLQFNKDQIKSEREVVKEERRYRVEDNIRGYLSEATYKSVYKVHPYRWPVIGYMKDLNAANIDDMKAFYKTYYSPNNAVIVVVGDVKTANVKKWVKKFYGAMPREALPDQKIAKEPSQKAQRERILRKNVQSSTLAVVFPISKAGDQDSYVLDLLANILGHGQSSRLYKRLVYRNQLATSATSWAYTPKDPGIFEIKASIKPGKNADTALNQIYSEIWKFRNKFVTDLELEKAKNQVMKSYVDSLKTISGKARSLAVNEILFGDYTVLFRDLDAYNSVTKKDIKRVAGKYLKPEQRSIIRVVPKEKNIEQKQGA